MPLEERPAPSAKNAGREETNMDNRNSRGEQPVAGPSNTSQRQGFCSCCQVLYNSVEQHILSTRHREVVQATRANVSSGSLMERFLQDVLQHHPHRYSDTRPTNADLPFLSILPVPREVLSEVCCGSEDDAASVGTREEMPTSDEESCRMLQAEANTALKSQSQHPPGTSQHVPIDIGAGKSAQTGLGTKKTRLEPPVAAKYSPTQGFLHRTSGKSAVDKPHVSSQLAQTVNPECSQTPLSRQPCSSETPPPLPGTPKFLHRKAHRKTNKHRECSDTSQGSRASLTTKCITSKGQPKPSRPIVTEPASWTAVLPPWRGPHRERTFSEQSDHIREVIEEVIERYCYGRSPKPTRHEDEISFNLSLHSISGSKDSEEWDNTLQVALQKPTTEDKHLARLMKVHINLEDEEYKTQLDTALNTVLESEQAEPEEAKENKVEEILPDLPHIPQSFVGKTWAQVMFEDDVKIDCMVKEFRQGQFRCYFDSESLAKFGKHCRKRKRNRKQENKPEDDECKDLIPLVEHHEEDPKHTPVFRKTRRRIYRMASRCQVVKVSHGTQTVSPSCPVVRKKTLPETVIFPNDPETRKEPSPERTPDMKTRLCALKLPASYCRIMSPLQPKTVVYVLSSPDGVQGTLKPTPIKRVGRKRKSSDEECAFKYKYKKTPLKYYDPLTNRILKTPPKGMSLTPSTKSLSHVRQLFRSLSPDINKERHSSALGRSPRRSKKGHGGSSMADHCASTSGSCLDSGGPSEPDSSMSSSRRALFSRSSISSGSHFLLGHLMPCASHTDSSSRTQAPSHGDGSFKVAAANLEEDRSQEQVDHPPVRRRSQRQGVKEKSLTPANKPSSPPYRTKRKSVKAGTRAKSRSSLQQKVGTHVAAGGRVSPRIKSSTSASPRSTASCKLAV
ncbi:DBF4-type zinc finger-containing protein 2 [Astyanax mexicanus]|uniref:DBF4-type zinc finger-containing protein 2 n=1 Tax=Astyanax mexicanus TaxID=7994 RepID=A0A8T2M3K9_ASTMX|nr:DBF4-type zinc finger-containing protein 2 [Astyanax mexicanus]